MDGGIAVLDFGGQYSHLICRRVRALGVYAALFPHDTPLEDLQKMKVAGRDALGRPGERLRPRLLRTPTRPCSSGHIPVLGICYGYQLIVQAHGGEVERASRREYGKSSLTILDRSGLFNGFSQDKISCWMSHSDSATRLPSGMSVLGVSDNSPFAAVQSADGRQFGVQFHPEVAHTEKGSAMLSNFVFNVCGAKRGWSMSQLPRRDRRRALGHDRRQGALRRLGRGRLLRRLGPAEQGGRRQSSSASSSTPASSGRARRRRSRSSSRRTSGVPDRVRRRLDRLPLGAQGRGRPRGEAEDHREGLRRGLRETTPGPTGPSGTSPRAPSTQTSSRAAAPPLPPRSSRPTTTWAVSPRTSRMEVVEPLRALYKDEVRSLGRAPRASREGPPEAPVPRARTRRQDHRRGHPREAEGLPAARTRSSRTSSSRTGVYNKVWQGFAYVGDDRVTGVLGDERKVGYQVTVKIVESIDAMTADWYRAPPASSWRRSRPRSRTRSRAS